MGNKNSYTEVMYVEDLNTGDFGNVKQYSYKGVETYIKVVKVYDGDTVHVVFKNVLHKDAPMMKYRCRMAGYDASELKTDEGKKAREYFEGIVEDKILWCKFGNFDKYGRPLITLYSKKTDLQSINNFIISSGHGKPYDGKGAKFDEQ